MWEECPGCCGYGVRQRCVAALLPFNAYIDWALNRAVGSCHCGASVGSTRVTDHVFADDTVILIESLEVLIFAVEALHEEAKHLVLKVSGPKPRYRYLKAS